MASIAIPLLLASSAAIGSAFWLSGPPKPAVTDTTDSLPETPEFIPDTDPEPVPEPDSMPETQPVPEPEYMPETEPVPEPTAEAEAEQAGGGILDAPPGMPSWVPGEVPKQTASIPQLSFGFWKPSESGSLQKGLLAEREYKTAGIKLDEIQTKYDAIMVPDAGLTAQKKAIDNYNKATGELNNAIQAYIDFKEKKGESVDPQTVTGADVTVGATGATGTINTQTITPPLTDVTTGGAKNENDYLKEIKDKRTTVEDARKAIPKSKMMDAKMAEALGKIRVDLATTKLDAYKKIYNSHAKVQTKEEYKKQAEAEWKLENPEPKKEQNESDQPFNPKKKEWTASQNAFKESIKNVNPPQQIDTTQLAQDLYNIQRVDEEVLEYQSDHEIAKEAVKKLNDKIAELTPLLNKAKADYKQKKEEYDIAMTEVRTSMEKKKAENVPAKDINQRRQELIKRTKVYLDAKKKYEDFITDEYLPAKTEIRDSLRNKRKDLQENIDKARENKEIAERNLYSETASPFTDGTTETVQSTGAKDELITIANTPGASELNSIPAPILSGVEDAYNVVIQNIQNFATEVYNKNPTDFKNNKLVNVFQTLDKLAGNSEFYKDDIKTFNNSLGFGKESLNNFVTKISEFNDAKYSKFKKIQIIRDNFSKFVEIFTKTIDLAIDRFIVIQSNLESQLKVKKGMFRDSVDYQTNVDEYIKLIKILILRLKNYKDTDVLSKKELLYTQGNDSRPQDSVTSTTTTEPQEPVTPTTEPVTPTTEQVPESESTTTTVGNQDMIEPEQVTTETPTPEPEPVTPTTEPVTPTTEQVPESTSTTTTVGNQDTSASNRNMFPPTTVRTGQTTWTNEVKCEFQPNDIINVEGNRAKFIKDKNLTSDTGVVSQVQGVDAQNNCTQLGVDFDNGNKQITLPTSKLHKKQNRKTQQATTTATSNTAPFLNLTGKPLPKREAIDPSSNNQQSTQYFQKQDKATSCGRNMLNNFLGRCVFVNESNNTTIKLPENIYDSQGNITPLTELNPNSTINLLDVCEKVNEREKSISGSLTNENCNNIENENYSVNVIVTALALLRYDMNSDGTVIDKRINIDSEKIKQNLAINIGESTAENNPPVGFASNHWVYSKYNNGKFTIFDSLRKERSYEIREDDLKTLLKHPLVTAYIIKPLSQQAQTNLPNTRGDMIAQRGGPLVAGGSHSTLRHSRRKSRKTWRV